MMTREEVKAKILSYPNADIVALHNDAVCHYDMPDNYIYSMEEFDNMNGVYTPWEITRMAFFGDFRPCDDYFYYNGYCNLESFQYWKEKEAFIDLDSMINYLIETDYY